MSQANPHTIVSGPSKWDLSISLFEGNPKHRHTVEFRIRSMDRLLEMNHRVAVILVEQEDGSGESFNFQGYTYGEGVARYRVEGCYNTQTRKGTFSFID